MNCQDYLYRKANPKEITRRWFLEQCGVGIGAIALGQLLAETGFAATTNAQPADPLAPKQPQFAPKAKRIIFLFMAGAASPLEAFSYHTPLGQVDPALPPPP